MLPVGKYMARAVDAELGFADTGTELVAVQFEVTEGENKGARLTWRGYFTEKTARRVIESLKHCGWEGRDWTAFEGLTKHVVQLDVQDDRDIKTGEVKGTRIAWVNPAKVPIKNAMDAPQIAAFASRMKHLVVEVMSSASGGQGSSGSRPFRDSKPQPSGARPWSKGGGSSGGTQAPRQGEHRRPAPAGGQGGDDPGPMGGDDIPFVTSRGQR